MLLTGEIEGKRWTDDVSYGWGATAGGVRATGSSWGSGHDGRQQMSRGRQRGGQVVEETNGRMVKDIYITLCSISSCAGMTMSSLGLRCTSAALQ